MRYNITKLLTLITLLLNIPIMSSAATVVWNTPSTTGDWGTAENWNPAQVPGAADSVDLTDSANSSTEITISGNQEVLEFSGTTAAGLITIGNGGSLTGWGTAASSFRASGLSMVVESGGQFIGGSTSSQTLRFDTTVNAGGVLDGFTIYQAMDLVNNGLFAPMGASSNHGVTLNASGGFSLTGSGAIRLDLFGNNDNEQFLFGNSPTVDFSGFSSIELLPDYSVQAGDTYDLWNLSSGTLDNIVFGSGSNIILSGSPGFTLDPSDWASSGILTVVAVPEPASIGLLLGTGFLLLIIGQRKKRRG